MIQRISGILFFLISLQLGAQVNFTPYSRFGIGQGVFANSARNGGMGNLGIGISDGLTVNRMNPATWSAVRVTTFDFTGQISYRNQSTSASQSNFLNGAFEHAGFVFRTNRKIAFGAGLAPYSGSNYQFIHIDSLKNDNSYLHYATNYQSKGGLTEFYVGGAATFFKKLRIGVSVPVLFGATKYYWDTQFFNNTIPSQTTTRKVNVYGLSPRIGTQYEDTLRFRKRVDILKLNEDRLHEFQKEEKQLNAEAEAIIRSKAALNATDSALNPVRRELEVQRGVLQERLDSVRASGAAGKHDIDQAEEAIRKVNTKRKKIDMKMQRKRRKLHEKERVVSKKREHATAETQKLLKMNQDIAGDSATRYRTDTSKVLFCIGATLEPGGVLNGYQKTVYHIDTTQYLFNESSNNVIRIPLRGGLGISLGKPGKWQAGVDVTRQNWGTFQYFTETYNLKPSLVLNGGFEYIRDAYSNRFARRIAWRGGGFYEQTNLEVKGHRINQMGITFGVGIPLFRPVRDVTERPVQPRVNLALVAGLQGTQADGLLREGYLMLRIGVNLSERWFFRRSLE